MIIRQSASQSTSFTVERLFTPVSQSGNGAASPLPLIREAHSHGEIAVG
jgi:hypothetical protein